jgi:hypothetical protein
MTYYGSIEPFVPYAQNSDHSRNLAFADICKYGTYYNPAWSHYGGKCNVICDRCNKRHLDVCIGWNNKDLCWSCVQIVNDTNKKSQVRVNQSAPVQVTLIATNGIYLMPFMQLPRRC